MVERIPEPRRTRLASGAALLYRADGWSVEQIAGAYELSAFTVRKLLREQGVRLNPQGRRSRGWLPGYPGAKGRNAPGEKGSP